MKSFQDKFKKVNGVVLCDDFSYYKYILEKREESKFKSDVLSEMEFLKKQLQMLMERNGTAN